MVDLFESPKRRVTRAREHFEDFKARGISFFQSKPYRAVIEPHLNGTRDVHKVVLAEPVPPTLTDLAVEMAEHLRAALDLTGYAAAVAGGTNAPKRAYFPIANSAAELETNVIGRHRCKDIPPDILAFFRWLKPYKGGNDVFWAINHLGNASKHKFLTAVGTAVDGINVRELFVDGTDVEFPPALTWDSAKNEMVLGITPAGTKLHHDLDLAFFIAFGEVDIIAGQPVLPFFFEAISSVEAVVATTEDECRRLGFAF